MKTYEKYTNNINEIIDEYTKKMDRVDNIRIPVITRNYRPGRREGDRPRKI